MAYLIQFFTLLLFTQLQVFSIGRLLKVIVQQGFHSNTGVKFPIQLLGLISLLCCGFTFTCLCVGWLFYIAEDYSCTFFLKHQESVVNLYIHCYTICERALQTCLLAIQCSFYAFIIDIVVTVLSFIGCWQIVQSYCLERSPFLYRSQIPCSVTRFNQLNILQFYISSSS